MFSRKGLFSSIGRVALMATVAAATLTAVEPSMAVAGSAPAGVSTAAPTSGATDISARRRYYRGGGGAAALGAFAAVVGTGLAIAATRDRDDYYYGGGPAYYGDGYYGGGPVYYGGGDPYPYGGYGYRRSSVPYFNGHPNPGW
jgi:hypothetical protein